ncbi:MAG: decaprenyl-phosphate phosphoribosyltransferase [Nocardioides sp.]|uniref:decaprenyl-phosphate phosphoribosyltransferase n=1 Tax=Nocardioides sp. TaxID=35761 RepID=UPI003F0A5690
MTSATGMIRTARPRQWVKNLLVFAAPLAAGGLGGSGWAVPVCFVAFCAASSGIYCFNDVADRHEDRLHPTKRERPVASGALSVPAALVLGVVLVALALTLAWSVNDELAALLLIYVVLQVAYVVRFKHEPVVDLFIVACGFLLRAIAGGVAAEIEVTQWFVLVAGFGALFMVSGKRYSEMVVLGPEAGTRRSLARYSVSYLRFVWGMAATATVMTYALWAFEAAPEGGLSWHVASIAPFLLGAMRYAVDVDSGAAAEPENVVRKDRALQCIGLVWLALVVAGTFGG